MFLRLLLALLIALPMPAMAACHAAQVETAATGGQAHHGSHVPPEPVKKAPHKQLCIGCIAPATIHPPVMGAPVAHGLVLTAPMRMAGKTLAAPAPDLPPPRSEA